MKQKGFASVILIFIGVFIIAGGLFAAAKTKILDKYLKAPITTSPTPTLSIAPSGAPAAEWKTYNNSKYGFSFKYPAEAKFSDSNVDTFQVSFMGPKQTASGRTQTELADGYAFAVVVVDASKITLDEYLQKNLEDLKNVCEPGNIGKYVKTNINGKDSYTYTSNCLGTFTTYLTKNGNQIYQINELYEGFTSEDKAGYKQIADKILSTFTFLKSETVKITPSLYTCPAGGWIDCMPGPDTKPGCSTEAINWYKENCPDFKGVAY